MKTTNRLFSLALITLGLIGSIANAQEHVGNGGNAIRIGNQLHLLDFVEAGIENRAQVASSIEPLAEHEVILKRAFAQYPLASNLVARKLAEIYKTSPVFADVMIQTVRNYQWAFVSLPVKTVHDAKVRLQFPRSSLYQAALRSETRVQVNRSIFEKLDSLNQAGLILHEILYIMMPTQDEEGRLTSDAARLANGLLFSNDVRQLDYEVLKRLVDGFDLDTTKGLYRMRSNRNVYFSETFSVRIDIGRLIHVKPNLFATKNGDGTGPNAVTVFRMNSGSQLQGFVARSCAQWSADRKSYPQDTIGIWIEGAPMNTIKIDFKDEGLAVDYNPTFSPLRIDEWADYATQEDCETGLTQIIQQKIQLYSAEKKPW